MVKVPHTLESEVADFHRVRVEVVMGVGVGFHMELAMEATMVGENGSKLVVVVVVVGMVMVVAYNV